MFGHPEYRLLYYVCTGTRRRHAMYRARPNLCGIGAAANSRFCTLGTERRERSATRLVSAGARIGASCKDWMMTSPGPGAPGPRARHAILRGKRAPLAGPDGPRRTFIDDPGPNATRFLQMEVVGSQGGLQSGFLVGCWHAAGLLAPWGGCRVSPGFPGTARECARERQRCAKGAPARSIVRCGAHLWFLLLVSRPAR